MLLYLYIIFCIAVIALIYKRNFYQRVGPLNVPRFMLDCLVGGIVTFIAIVPVVVISAFWILLTPPRQKG